MVECEEKKFEKSLSSSSESIAVEKYETYPKSERGFMRHFQKDEHN